MLHKTCESKKLEQRQLDCEFCWCSESQLNLLRKLHVDVRCLSQFDIVALV